MSAAHHSESEDDLPESLDLKSSRESALRMVTLERKANERHQDLKRQKRRLTNDLLVKQATERKMREALVLASLLKQSSIKKRVEKAVTRDSERKAMPVPLVQTVKPKIHKITGTKKSVVVIDESYADGVTERLNRRETTLAIQSRTDFYDQATRERRTKAPPAHGSNIRSILYRPAITDRL
jgi:hypothetical protein